MGSTPHLGTTGNTVPRVLVVGIKESDYIALFLVTYNGIDSINDLEVENVPFYKRDIFHTF